MFIAAQFFISIFISSSLWAYTSNATACEVEVLSYMRMTVLPSDVQDECDGYVVCLHEPRLKDSSTDLNTYEIFVENSNWGGYPSTKRYEVLTDKDCRVIDHIEK